MNRTFWTLIAMIACILVCNTIQLQACAMTAVISNGTHQISEGTSGLGFPGTNGESDWLYDQGAINDDGHGMVYYHKSGLTGHDYQMLPYSGDISTFSMSSNNHLYRRTGSIQSGYFTQFVSKITTTNTTYAVNAKIFMGHVRYRTSGPTGAYAPFVYRYIHTVNGVSDTVDYSFSHHGTMESVYNMVYYLPDFFVWLIDYDTAHGTYYAWEDHFDDYVDSDYLFLWLIKNVTDCNGDVKLGLSKAFKDIYSNGIDGQVNVFFSDGTGVYAYTNQTDDPAHDFGDDDVYHIMSYKANSSEPNPNSYLVRSWNQIPSNWTVFNAKSLYYFPTDGKMQEYTNIHNTYAETLKVKKGINYIGFPVLNGTTQPLSSALQSISCHANKIKLTTPGSSREGTYTYSDATQSWSTNLTINRTYGYVLEMDSTYVDYMKFNNGTSTPTNTLFSFYSQQQTWVPYILEESQTPADAFGANFSHVTAVSAEDWYIYKQNGVWYGWIGQGATGTMDYGKMYKISVDLTFTQAWNQAKSNIKPFQKLQPEYFNIEEQSSYQIVEIESIGSDSPVIEIGAFLNGVCVGASRVTEYPVHLQVYCDTPPELLQYRYVTEANRSYQSLPVTLISVIDQVIRNGVPEFTILNLGSPQNDAVIPVAFVKASAYPNPFRTATSIRLEASKDSPVKVSVYNVKGEKVSDLYNGILTKGNHNVIWNAKDTSGKQMAQGVYFYRVDTANNSQTQKLLILK